MRYLAIISALLLVVGCAPSKSVQIVGDPIPTTTISNENLHEYNLDEIATVIAVRDSIGTAAGSKKGNR